MSRPTIAAVLFDVDGTLVDSNDLHAAAWRAAFSHFGIDLPFELVRAQVGKGGDNLVPALLPPQIVDTRQDEIEACHRMLFRRDYRHRVEPFPGVMALFERLRGDGVSIVLATSSSRDDLDHHIALLGCRDAIDAATCRDDVAHSKPCPDVFEAALATLDPLSPDDVLVIGDSPHDIAAARKAGLETVAVRCGGFSDAALLQTGAILVFEGPQDILDNYERLFARAGQGGSQPAEAEAQAL